MPNEERVHEVISPLPLGPDEIPQLILRAMTVKERISEPFEYTLRLLSVNSEIDPNELLGKSMTVVINIEQRKRYFNGLVSSFINLGRAADYAQYQVVLRPWFWFLMRNSNCRIFQDLSVVDIFEKVAKDTHGFSDFRKSLTETHKKKDYCVQYRESDFGFLSRLLEEEGIFYFFEHKNEEHTMVLGDTKTSFGKVEGPDGSSNICYRAPGEALQEQEHVSIWQVQHEVQSAKTVLDDFDFTKPKVDLEARSEIKRQHDQAGFEVYDYPGLFSETSDAEKYAKIRIEELQSRHKELTGQADHRGMEVGRSFNLTEYPRSSENGEYVILATEIQVESGEIEQLRADAENRFDVSFIAYPGSEPYRPPRRTLKPTVKGPQTAIVVGKAGEEIWTDKYARVKVQFHWDREGQRDENSSCWVRVSQLWAGKNWGGIQIPRIGQEVVVDFLEGDPDRPLITGRVYNDEMMPPYALPDNQTQSGVISRSTKTGNPDTFNELRFEDKIDEEEVYFHAEKNFSRVVENDDTLKVGFDKNDPGDQTIEIFNNQVLKIGTDTAGDGSQSIEVWKDRKAEIKTGNDDTTVSQGDHSLSISAGKSTTEAAQKIVLKVGSSSITIEPGRITIAAPEITIQGDATIKVSSPMTTVEGSGMAIVKGGLVKIN